MPGSCEETAHQLTGSSREFAGRTASIASARHFVVDLAAALGCGADVQSRLALVVSELASNAVEASDDDYTVSVEARDDGGVVLIVTNSAERADIPDRGAWGPDEPLAARGRGLGIVEHLASSVDVVSDRSTVTVTALVAPN